MGIADDFAKLRSEGYSDDDILESYKGFDPQYSSDIDKLRGEGMASKDILDGLVTFKGASPQPQKDEPSELSQMLPALQHGAATKIEGYGSTARNLGVGENSVERFGHDWKPRNYEPATGKFLNPSDKDAGIGGFGWKYLPRTIAETLPGIGIDLGAGALTGGLGFLASSAGSQFGPSLDARRVNNGATVQPDGRITGGKELGAGDYAIAAGSTALQAYLNKLGLLGGKVPGIGSAIEGATNTAIKGGGLAAAAKIPGVLGKSAAIEGATSALGDAIQQAGDSVGTDKGLDIDPHRALGIGAIGGATGAGLRATKIPGDVVNIVREAGTDQNSNIRVADRYNALESDIKNPKQQSEALGVVDKQIGSAISTGKQQAGWMLKEPETGLKVQEAIDAVSSGAKLTKSQKADLDTILDQHSDGKLLKDSILDADTNNRIKSRGHFSTKGDTFEGGLGGLVGDYVYPNRNLGRALAAVGVGSGAAGQLSLPFMAQLGVMAPYALKGLGVMAGLSAGVKGIDAVTGGNNPVAKFRDQYSGMQADETVRANAIESPTETKARQAVENALSKDAASNQKRIDRTGLSAVKDSVASTTKALGRYRDLENGLAGIEDRARIENDKQASSEASRKAKETDAAWKAHEASKTDEGPSPALSDRLWAPHEAVRTDPKAKQVEDLWSKAEEKANNPDWSDNDAQSAIDRANNSRLKGAQGAMAEAMAKSRADRKAVDPEPEKPKKAKASAKGPKEATNDDSPVDTITVRVGDSVVTRPREGIKNEKAYKSALIDRMTKRQDAVNEARPITQTRQQDVDALLERLNTSAKSWPEAQSHIEDFITGHDDIDVQSKLWDWYNKNEGKLKGTYDR